MDRASLRAVEGQAGMPVELAGLPDGAAGLLVEFQAATPEALAGYREAAAQATPALPLLGRADFTDDPAKIARLWRVREGMYPSISAVRASGTTVIIEDVAFPVERLADAAVDLEHLFAEHGYDEAILFGHAGDGNLHFVIAQSFNDDASVERYARLMDDVVALVVGKYDGALKAEHGTGRNMAPFVEAEWGPEALAIMQQLKVLADPDGVLNPGVILNPDPRAHLVDLKTLPTLEPEVDTCAECGFCEHVCPSRDLTLTPRQRIVVRREILRLEEAGAPRREVDAMWRDYVYAALDTCAADGMCATACPVGIDTGRLVKRFRHARRSWLGEASGRFAATSLGAVESLVRGGLAVGGALRRVAGRAVPFLPADLPGAATRLPATERDDAAAVYLPACVSRVFGPSEGDPSEYSTQEALVAVATRAGVPVWIPPDVRGTCCGMAFASKGLAAGLRVAANRAVDRCWAWTDGGRLPVVLDASSCTLGLRECGDALTGANRSKLERMRILDAVELAARELLPRLHVHRRVRSVAVHPTCAVVKMGIVGDLTAIASACADEVVIPRDAGCCGFAGDRGFFVPELTAAATRLEAASLRDAGCDDFVSSNRTCELAMARATGRAYRSVVQLLEEATRAPA
jgi:D-lactate dehydrogenase